VARLDFRTSCGYLEGAGARRASQAPGAGPKAVITDFGVLRPNPATEELELASVYPGVSAEAARAATGWPLKLAASIETVPPPQSSELAVLRELHARTAAAHVRPVHITLPS
jgi:glutaconate CoA-transferase, subunit B